LRYSDRLFWVTLRRLWPNWRKPILIVKPDTVVRWHRKGFRLYWRFRSRSKLVARPITALDVRTAIQTMARENPWGAPRIHGELLKLGFEISEANRLAIPFTVASKRQGGSTVANLSEESP
jgi:hypothetical protein